MEDRGKRGTGYAEKILTAALLALLSAILASAYGCRKKIALFHDELPEVEPDPDTHVYIRAAEETETNIVYAPLEDRSGYRYGPSIIYYADGSCDAWFSTSGYGGEWDWITVRHSDNGVDFGRERVALVPNPDSMDKYSCCDPGVVYFGGYYYLGYTSTIVSTNGGVNNNVFVARSRNAQGPYEKWNGSGWGGDPQPIIYYDEYDLQYGAGEPSFVVRGNTLYVYYTWICPDGSFTRVATSDTEEDWPARLTERGTCYQRTNGQDSSDVVYLEDAGKFVAFSTQYRFSENSGIAIFESEDGISFRQTGFVRENLYQYCHNMGFSHRPDGHVQLKDRVFAGYAFSDGASGNWGKWATAFQPVSLELYKYSDPDSPIPGRDAKSLLCTDYFSTPEQLSGMIGIATTNRIIDDKAGEGAGYHMSFVWLDSALNAHLIEDVSNIKFSGYDKSICTFKKQALMFTDNTGETTVTVTYKGYTTTFKVYARAEYSEIRGQVSKTVKVFEPVKEVYDVEIGGHQIQIRGYTRFSDNTWGEAYNGSEGVEPRKFPVTYEVADESVAKVSDRGIITAVAPGTTTVKVTIAGGMNFTVTVNVKDPEAPGS
jgi:predicted GH43/DUF377 family glycosyl hydrolase